MERGAALLRSSTVTETGPEFVIDFYFALCFYCLYVKIFVFNTAIDNQESLYDSFTVSFFN